MNSVFKKIVKPLIPLSIREIISLRKIDKLTLKKLHGCIYFLHIGKTGGGSIATWLHSIIHDDLVFEGQFDGSTRFVGTASVESALQELAKYPARQRRKLKLVMGHLPLPLMTHLPQPARCVTVLREPVDHSLSTLFYLKSIPGQRGDYYRQLSISDYVNSTNVADNYQTRTLTGLDELNPVWHPNQQYAAIHGRLDLLELAKENIKKYFVAVGLFEALPEFAMTLAKLIGYEKPVVLEKNNVTPFRKTQQEITEEERELLRSKVDLDLALYDWVKTIRSSHN